MALQKLVRLFKGKAQNLVAADTGQVPGDLRVDGAVIKALDTGGGLVIGNAPSGAATGSTLQILSVTSAQRDQLVPSVGAVVWNTTTGSFQFYNGTYWKDVGGSSPATVYTADAALVANQSGRLSTNQGAPGAVALTLPTPAVTPTVLEYKIAVVTAQYFRFTATGGATITLGTNLGVPNTTAANGFVRSNVLGSMLHLHAVSTTQWFAEVTGTWSVDA